MQQIIPQWQQTRQPSLTFHPALQAFLLIDGDVKDDMLTGVREGNDIRQEIRFKPLRVDDRFGQSKDELPGSPISDTALTIHSLAIGTRFLAPTISVLRKPPL